MPQSPLGPFPTQPGVDQLVWLIRAADAGEVQPEAFIQKFRDTYESIEANGRVGYASKDQARLIWDVLWSLEYYSPDPSKESRPDDWNTLEAVMKIVHRTAQKLTELE